MLDLNKAANCNASVAPKSLSAMYNSRRPVLSFKAPTEGANYGVKINSSQSLESKNTIDSLPKIMIGRPLSLQFSSFNT